MNEWKINDLVRIKGTTYDGKITNVIDPVGDKRKQYVVSYTDQSGAIRTDPFYGDRLEWIPNPNAAPVTDTPVDDTTPDVATNTVDQARSDTPNVGDNTTGFEGCHELHTRGRNGEPPMAPPPAPIPNE